MRTLKFRAYDSATGKVSEPFDVKESWGDYLIDFEDYSTDGALDSIIWEQFTGLLDRNGKEIYDGDIVRYSFTNPNRTYTEPVSFGPIQDGEGYYHQEFLAWRTTWADDGEAHSSLLDLVEPNWTCEIIGNIHENPELMEGEE